MANVVKFGPLFGILILHMYNYSTVILEYIPPRRRSERIQKIQEKKVFVFWEMALTKVIYMRPECSICSSYT